ncbi:hypothetical protein FACS189490_00860 [Clostridia bacterium]|nr:hypothetical protein FACS189490_00860 [Clostridia bacterium]
MKKFLVTIFLVGVLFVSTSCESVPSEDALRILRPFVTFFAKTFLPEPDGKIADRRFFEILDALENKNSDVLKAMLSKHALSNAENIDENIADVFGYYQGKYVSHSDWGGPAWGFSLRNKII